MLLDEGILTREGNGLEVEIEGDPMGQAQRAHGIVPLTHEHRRTGRIDPATILGEKRPFGDNVEPGKESEAFVKDRAHDVTMAGMAKEFSREERPHGMGGRNFFGTGQAGVLQELGERDRRQRGEKEKQAPKFGAQLARPEVEPPHIRDRRGRGPGGVGAFIVRTAGQPCTSFFLQEKGDGHGAQGVSLRLQGLTDIVNREVLLPQRHDVVAHRIPFWGVVWSFAGLDEEGAVGVLAKLVTEHAKTPRGLAKPLGNLLRGQSLNTIRPECLVLPVGGVGWFEEDPRDLCKRFSCTDKHTATLLTVQRRIAPVKTSTL